MNENAKLPAFYSELPEADHNELCGWGVAPRPASPPSSSRTATSTRAMRRRFELTAEAVAGAGAAAVRVETAGETRVARLLWATMLGDLVSLELARRAGSTRSRSRRSSASRRRWGRHEGDGPGGRPGDAPAADHLRHAEADGAGR